MEKNQMGRPSGRPYNRTCGMMNAPSVQGRDCEGRFPGKGGLESMRCTPREAACTGIYQGLQSLPCAMAYVPSQNISQVYDLSYGLQTGTIFPELCRPFCGRRGGCR